VTKLFAGDLTWFLVLFPLNIVLAIVTLILLGRAQKARLAQARETAAQGWAHSSSS
jgi:hypothetical protein